MTVKWERYEWAFWGIIMALVMVVATCEPVPADIRINLLTRLDTRIHE